MRPTTIFFGDGQIILKDLSSEDKERFNKLINPEVQTEAVNPTLTHIAWGLVRDKAGTWHIYELAYDPETKQSKYVGNVYSNFTRGVVEHTLMQKVGQYVLKIIRSVS